MAGSASPAIPGPQIELPTVTAEVNFSQRVPRASSNLIDPSKTYRPLEAHRITIRDARPIRDRLDLDREGFRLLDHVSTVSHLRKAKELEGVYHDEIGRLIKDVTGCDVVIPYRTYCQVRLSQRAPGENGDETSRPAGFVHADVTRQTFLDWVESAQEDEGVKVPGWRRATLFNAWRAVSKPPQDFPLAITDGMSVKAGNYVVMDNVTSMEPDGRKVETRLGLFDPEDRWYYFSNMREDEVLLFKSYDSQFDDAQTVIHTAFDNTPKYPQATPRESIEARFFALWV